MLQREGLVAKFAFECPDCQVQFERNLKMGEHPSHPCPSCQGPAPRVWMGQGFGFDFAASPTAAPANTGVSKKDYPTGDQIVGAHAEARWGRYHEREKVKQKVRETAGTRTLVRRMGEDYIEYQAGSKNLVEGRKQLVKEATAKGWGVEQAPKDSKASGGQ